MTSQFVLVGARGLTPHPSEASLIRPGTAELLALYHRVLMDPTQRDQPLQWPTTPWTQPDADGSGQDVLKWLVEQDCQPVCTCMPDPQTVGGNVHVLSRDNRLDHEQLTLKLPGGVDAIGKAGDGAQAPCLAHNNIWTMPDGRPRTGGSGRVPYLASIHMTEDLRQLREWRATMRHQLLIAEIPYALSVLDALYLGERSEVAVDIDHRVEHQRDEAGDQLSLLGLDPPSMPDFGSVGGTGAVGGHTELFIRPATGSDGGQLVLEARAGGAAIEMPIPAALMSGHERLFLPAPHEPSSDDRQDEDSEAQVLRLVPLLEPQPPSRHEIWIGPLTRPRTITMIFGVVLAAVVGVRFAVLNAGGAPPTIDAGNWLSFADSILGHSPRDSSIAYPPVVPLLTELFTAMFGIKSGVAALGAVSSAAPAIGLYVALRMAGVGRLRIVPALLLLGAGSIGEAAAWGGFPQLLGMAILPVTVVLGLRFIDAPSRRLALSLGAGLMASLATSHFVSAILIFALASAVLIDSIATRSLSITRRHLTLAPLVALPSLWLIGIYAKLIDAVIFNPNEFAALDNLTWSNVLQRLDTLYSDFPELWQILVPLALVTPGLTWYQRRSTVWRLATSLLIAVSALLLLTTEGRYLYFVPLVALALLAVWTVEAARAPGVAEMERPVRIAYGFLAVAIVAAVVLQLSAGISRFDAQREFYAALSPGLVEAIESADDLVTAEPGGERGAIAIPSLNDAPVGWWVEALTEETVVYGSPLRWLNFGNEIERASAANKVFRPTFPDDESLSLLQASGVRVVVMPRQWAWYDDESMDRWVTDNSLEVVVRNHDALTIYLG